MLRRQLWHQFNLIYILTLFHKPFIQSNRKTTHWCAIIRSKNTNKYERNHIIFFSILYLLFHMGKKHYWSFVFNFFFLAFFIFFFFFYIFYNHKHTSFCDCFLFLFHTIFYKCYCTFLSIFQLFVVKGTYHHLCRYLL